MKKTLGLIILLFVGLMTVSAMSYQEARDRARFLTDKMAYELNLNDEQYNDAYEINLDYLMSIRTSKDAYGNYWKCRDMDFRYILYDWQYTIFRAAEYFFRPVIWRADMWFLPIYNIYGSSHFYYHPPKVYYVYHGGHGRRRPHLLSHYEHRRPAWDGGFRGKSKHSIHQHRSVSERPPSGHGFRFEQPRSNRPNSDLAQRRERPSHFDFERSSNYKRPSSTRTTVNKVPERKRPTPSRSTNTAPPQRSNRPSGQSTRSKAPTRSTNIRKPNGAGRGTQTGGQRPRMQRNYE